MEAQYHTGRGWSCVHPEKWLLVVTYCQGTRNYSPGSAPGLGPTIFQECKLLRTVACKHRAYFYKL